MSLPKGYHSPQLDVEVRLNTNESPWPPPDGFGEAVSTELARLDFNRYPDRAAMALREAIGARHGVDPSRVFCSNGSNESIQLLLAARAGPGKRAMVFRPTYTLHSHLSTLGGTDLIEADRGNDFALDVATVERAVAAESPEVVFLCIPNNPTGTLDPPDVVDAALAGPGLVLVDEAYSEFAGAHTTIERVDHDNVAVVRTFSKAWAMAGLRLGYTVAGEGLVGELSERALPYHLDVVKQAAGTIGLKFEPEMQERVRRIVTERERLRSEMGAMDLTVWDSAANFLLFRPAMSAEAVWAGLVARSVLVRDLSTAPGLEGCLRVTVGTPLENDRFLESLADVLGEGGT